MSTWAASCGWKGKMTETACEQKTVSFWLTHFTLKLEPEALCYHFTSSSSCGATENSKIQVGFSFSFSNFNSRELPFVLENVGKFIPIFVPKFILNRHSNNVLNKPII